MRIAAVALAALAIVAGQAQQQPTFRSTTETVSIYATVRASDGRFVPGLTREDFDVRDNGVARDIVIFSREMIPITVTMMLDMSGSQEQGVKWTRDAGRAFVDQLLPEDRARIGTFGTEIAISPRLTSDKAYLRRVLDEEIWPGGGTPLWEAMHEAMTSLSGEDGRRVVLVLTDGFDSVPSSWASGSSLPKGPELIGANGKPLMTREIPFSRYDEVGRRAVREHFMFYAVARQQMSPVALSQEMSQLALESGGGFRTFAMRQDARSAMTQVAEELHHQYLIGFAPVAIDNRVHELDIKVKRSGMSVMARKRYLADGR